MYPMISDPLYVLLLTDNRFPTAFGTLLSRCGFSSRFCSSFFFA